MELIHYASSSDLFFTSEHIIHIKTLSSYVLPQAMHIKPTI